MVNEVTAVVPKSESAAPPVNAELLTLSHEPQSPPKIQRLPEAAYVGDVDETSKQVATFDDAEKDAVMAVASPADVNLETAQKIQNEESLDFNANALARSQEEAILTSKIDSKVSDEGEEDVLDYSDPQANSRAGNVESVRKNQIKDSLEVFCEAETLAHEETGKAEELADNSPIEREEDVDHMMEKFSGLTTHARELRIVEATEVTAASAASNRSKEHGTKLTGPPRVTNMPKNKPTAAVSSFEKGKLTDKKLTGLPRVAMDPTSALKREAAAGKAKPTAKEGTGVPRVAKVQKAATNITMNETKVATKVVGLPRVATAIRTSPSQGIADHEIGTMSATKLTGLPRVATMQNKSANAGAGLVDEPKSASKLRTGLPRVATLPTQKIHATGSIDCVEESKPNLKLTGLPRVALIQTPTREPPDNPQNYTPPFHALPVPHYPSPKENATLIPIRPVQTSPSKVERDLQECQKQFKALPLPHFREQVKHLPIKHSMAQVNVEIDDLGNNQFKALPMPNFIAAHARLAMIKVKPLTRPIAFHFHTEERIKDRRARGVTQKSASDCGVVKSGFGVAKAKLVTKTQSRSKRRADRPKTRKGKCSKESPQLLVANPITHSENVAVALVDEHEALNEKILDEHDHELDQLLGGGDEEEIIFSAPSNDEAGAGELEKLLGSQAMKESPDDAKTPNQKDNSPNDVQAFEFGCLQGEGCDTIPTNQPRRCL